MKRDAFLLEHYEREATYDEWARAVLARPGEAPYELLRVWRHAYAVPASEPHANVHLELDAHGGFLLADARLILLYARAGHVTLYHEALPPMEYAGWRARSVDGWPWHTRPLPQNSLLLLPVEVWCHFAHLLLERKRCVARLVEFVCAPLCKGWFRMWNSPRIALDGFWQRQAHACDIYRSHYPDSCPYMPRVNIVRQTLSLFQKALDGTLGNRLCDMLVQWYRPRPINHMTFGNFMNGSTIHFGSVRAQEMERHWSDTLQAEPGGRRAWIHETFDAHGVPCVRRITCAEELFSICIGRVPFRK